MSEHRNVETGEQPVPIALLEQALAGQGGEHADGAAGPWPYLGSGGPPTDATRETRLLRPQWGAKADVEEQRCS